MKEFLDALQHFFFYCERVMTSNTLLPSLVIV